VTPGDTPGAGKGTMKATFTEEQQHLAELAERLAERIAAEAREGGDPDADAREGGGAEAGAGWPLLVETGLVGLRLPADAGGGASSAVEVAIVAEALGRHAVPVPFVGPVLAGDLLASAGAPTDLLEEAATGQRRLTIALDRSLSGPGRFDGAGGAGGGGVIGWDSRGAESLVGLLRERDGTVRAALSPGTGPALNSSDLTRQLVRAGAGEPTVVGDALGEAARLRWEAFGLVLLCADMVGAMTGSLELAVAYAKERVQFKRPIGSFQAVAHLAADQHVSTEASRSATYYAAWAVDGLAPAEALAAARIAKAYVSPRAREVTEAVLQIHGGIGHTWEHRAHYFLRRALLSRRTLGDESVHLGHIADGVLGGGLAGPASAGASGSDGR
jgi:alkylation response protein AidB-like acyl-CoA dehydrogenase